MIKKKICTALALALPLGCATQGLADITINTPVTGSVYGNGSGLNNSTPPPTPRYSANGYSVTVESGGAVSSDVYGGYVYNSDPVGGSLTANKNVVSIKGGTVGHYVYGGFVFTGSDADTATVTANENTVSIDGGAVSFGGVAGGYASGSTSGAATATGNEVTLVNGATVDGNVDGGFAYADSADATASGNKVSIDGGSVSNGVRGGDAVSSTSGAATANENVVSINGGAVESLVHGGNASTSSGTATATGNEVWLSNGVTGIRFVHGGEASSLDGDTAANSNIVSIDGVTVEETVWGGMAISPNNGAATANNNSVTLNNATVGSVTGGESRASGAATANKNRVEISGGTVGDSLNGIYGGWASSSYGVAETNENTVSINGGLQVMSVYGGWAMTAGMAANASMNTVTLSGGTVGNEYSASLYGGYAMVASGAGTATANGNTAEISGGAVGGGDVAGIVYGGNALSSGAATANGNTVSISGGMAGSGEYGGIYGGSAQTYSSTGTATADGNTVEISGGAVEVDVYGGSAVSPSGAGTANNNTVTISGSPVFGAATTLYGGFVLNSDDYEEAAGAVYSGNTLNLNSPITVQGVKNFQVINFGYSGDANLTNLETRPTGDGKPGIELNTDTNDIKLNAVISGSGGLTKTGKGALTLTGPNSYTGPDTYPGPNTYTGPTTINGGTLKVDGSIASSSLTTVANGGTLTGTGTVGTTVVESGGTLKGASGDKLTLGNLTLQAGSHLDVTLGVPSANPTAAAGTQLFKVNGIFTSYGSTLDVHNAGGFGNGLYRLIDYTGGALAADSSFTFGTMPVGYDIGVTSANAGYIDLLVGASTGGSGGPPFRFWDGANTTANGAYNGGNGNWNATSTNWTNAAANENGVYDSAAQLIFAGAAGTVTVDPAGVSVGAGGLQFVTSGYTVTGGTIALGSGVKPLRVGDGTTAGAATTATIASAITGNGGIDKTDLGTLVLTGVNTYSGGTTISSGRLTGSGTSFGSGAIVDNAALVLDQATAATFANAISGSGTLTKQGAGNLTLTGVNTYTGGTTISSGTLTGSATSFGSGAIHNFAALVLDQAANASFANAIDGNGTLTKTGAGALTLSGANTYSGGTTVSAGTLAGTTTSLQGTIANNANLEFNQAVNGVFTGTISGAGDLTKNGTGGVSLAGNVNQNNVAINSGALNVNSGFHLAATGNLSVASGAQLGLYADNTPAVNAGTVTAVTGAILNVNGYAGSGQKTVIQTTGGITGDFILHVGGAVLPAPGLDSFMNVTLEKINAGLELAIDQSLVWNQATGAHGTFNIASGNFTLADSLANNTTPGAGTTYGWDGASLTKTGAGILTLTGDNTYTGSTTVNAGILAGNITANTDLTVASGATYDGTGSARLVNGLNGGGKVINADGLTAQSGAFAGVISGLGSLTKTGDGTLTLSGNNTYTGGTTVNAGILAGNITANTDLTVAGGATYDGTGAARSVNGLHGDGTIINFSNLSVQSGTFGGVLAGNGSLTKAGDGVLTLSGINTYTGLTEVKGGTLALSGNGAISPLLALYGGTTFDTGGKAVSLSQLDVYGTANWTGNLNMANQTMNFYLPTSMGDGNVMLSVSGWAEIGGSQVNVGALDGARQPLKVGDKVTLIDAIGGLSGTTNASSKGEGMQGVTIKYEFDLTTDDGHLYATVAKAGLTDGTEGLSQGFVSGVALLNQSADLVAGWGMDAAVNAAQRPDRATGWGAFGTAAGGWSRYETGSSVDVSSISFMAGLSKRTNLQPGSLVVGLFFEYGNGSYDTYSGFNQGDGDLDHLGGGIIGRMDFADAGKGHFYAEASVRAGGVNNDYNFGGLSTYESSSAYYGIHAGAGYVWKVADKTTLDLYGKYFWTGQQGDDVRLSTGETVSFDNVNSHRLRAGGRLAYTVAENLNLYGGMAYEHEFDGEAKAHTNGFAIATPSIDGGTGIGELGLTLKPTKGMPVSLDLGVQGYAGQREGVTGALQIRYEF